MNGESWCSDDEPEDGEVQETSDRDSSESSRAVARLPEREVVLRPRPDLVSPTARRKAKKKRLKETLKSRFGRGPPRSSRGHVSG